MSRRSQPSNRKIVDRETKSPEVLVGRGNLSVDDKTLLTMLLGRFGITTEYVPAAEYNEREREFAAFAQTEAIKELEETVRFSDITEPSQFLIREHLESFRRTYGKDKLPRNFVGFTFNYLVDGHGSPRHLWEYTQVDGRSFRVPTPLEGIIVKPRSELGIGPYQPTLDPYGRNRLCSQYAVQAGSVVEVADALAENGWNQLLVAQKGLTIVAMHLRQQFEETQNGAS